METNSFQLSTVRRREGARGRRERRLRADARIRLQLCPDAVRIASHRGGDGCRRAHTEASTQTAPVDEPPVTEFEYVSPALVIECVAPAVGSLPYEVFSAPVCDQVHQEFIAAREITENIADIPVVQEQVIVQENRCGVPAVHHAPAPAVFQATLVEEYIAPAPAMYVAPASVEKYIAPAPAVYAAPAFVEKFIALAPAVYAAPAPVVELLPVPAVVQAPTPAVEYIAPLPVVFQAPTPAEENIAPAPDVQAPTLVEGNIAPAPAVLLAPAPVCEVFFTRASSVPVASARTEFHLSSRT